jgi:hypothetical protein
MAAPDSVLTLTTAGLASNEQGFSNCCFVSPSDLAALAATAGVDEKTAASKGVLCAVNEGVFYVKCVQCQPAALCRLCRS